MQLLYTFLFVLVLLFPFASLVNAFLNNDNFILQKRINNITFFTMIIFCFILAIFYLINGETYLNLFSISREVPIIFSSDSFNLSFGIFISLIIFYFNYIFQNSFNLLNLSDKYNLYNRQISCLYALYILLSFSHNIVISILLYTLILIYSYFLITNPDLKDFRKDYSVVLTISFVSSMIFLCIVGFYFIYNGDNLFTFQNMKNLENIEMYWLLVVLFLLILINLSGPIYFIFKEKFYYEDLLPMLTILVFPFVIFNTFLFTKILYYVFYNNISNVGLYFYYSGFFLIFIFALLFLLNIKYIKNGVKFVLLFSFINFVVFFSQFLFLNTEYELTKLFVNFLLIIFSMTITVLSYTEILFELLSCNTTNTGNLYKYSKSKINIYILSSFLLVMTNFISFITLDFNNFNILYFFNLIELFLVLFLYIAHIAIILRKKIDNEEEDTKIINALKDNRISFGSRMQIIFIIILILLFFLNSTIVDFILTNKTN